MGALAELPDPRKLAPATLKQQMLKQLVCSDAPEQALRYYGFTRIAGVDEVGRGALFGPVVAAAVILPKNLGSLARSGLTDSKKLTREERECLDKRIRRMAVAIAVAEIDAETIDRVNIFQATRLAMMSAIQKLPAQPDHLLIDAMRLDHPCPQTRLFYGDSLSLSIAAASVIAKVHRDALCRRLHEVYPVYGLASHKGYATPEHRKALREHGPCPLHRRSFAPVRNADLGATPDLAMGPGEVLGEVLFDDAPLSEPVPQTEAAWA